MQNETGYRRETVVVLESHIDHLSGEEIGHAFDRLLESGALDVLWLPGIMKKNRPGGSLRVICAPDKEDAVLAAFFRHTHTLGIRRQPMERLVLPRGRCDADLDGSRVAAKEYLLEGEQYVRMEHEALAHEAGTRGLGIPALRFRKK
jgi:uncharacterized protein (DUF111 family)